MKHYLKYYCKDYENIENYEKAKADNFKCWDCHHRLETHNSDGERRLVDITRDELKALGMYYDRPASELIFLTSMEHISLHHKGKQKSEETRKKLSEANKGHTVSAETRKKISEAWDYDKHFNEESRRRMSEAAKGKHLSEETKKKLSEANKGKHLSEETRKKMSLQKTGRHWYNNGKINIMSKECPDGFVSGKLLIYKETEK